MGLRYDVSIDWKYRIITVDAPSTSITVPDLITTGRNLEQQMDASDDLPLLYAGGATTLDATRKTGLTIELRNATVAFGARTTSVESGTATSADANGYTLIDTAANFSTVEPGAMVINFSDLSITTVLEVVDSNTLYCLKLADGSNNDWEIGDSYKVWNVVQCEVSGGNLVASDAVGSPQNPIFPTAGTQVLRSLDQSASLIAGSGVDVQEIVDGVLDEPLTGASHNDPTSVGRRIRQSQVSSVVHEGIAQSATASTFVMDTAAEAIDDFYDHNYVVITGGTGTGQSRSIQTYVGSSRTANIVPDWVVTPDATSEFIVFPMPEVHAHEVHEPVDVSTAGVNATRDAVLNAVALNFDASGTVGQVLNMLRRVGFNRVEEQSGNPGTLVLYADDDTTPIATMQLLDEDGGEVTKQAGMPARRSKAPWPP